LGRSFGCTKENGVKFIQDATLKERNNAEDKFRLLREADQKPANKNDDLEGYEFAVFFMK